MDWATTLAPAHRAALAALLEDPKLAEGCAAFDADGTLWAGDVGELVLQGAIGLGRVPRSAWDEYEKLLAVDAPKACAFCLEVMRGVRVEELERWSGELVRARAHEPLFRGVIGFARELERRGCEVWVVSGSNAWTVRAAVRAAGLDERRVLALTGPSPEGVFTGAVDQPVTCAQGKVEALRKATARPLRLAAGNALYDLDLLEASAMPVAVGPSRSTPLLELAERRGWITWRAGA